MSGLAASSSESYGEWSWDVEWLLEEAARAAAQRDWRRMGVVSRDVAYGFLVASYRRRMGVVAVREMARHRYRQSQMVGLTRAQLSGIAREAQRHGEGVARGRRSGTPSTHRAGGAGGGDGAGARRAGV